MTNNTGGPAMPNELDPRVIAMCHVAYPDYDGLYYHDKQRIYQDYARLLAAADAARPLPEELSRIEQTLKEGGCEWKPCTGCYEGNVGTPSKDYPFSTVLKTQLGSGCHECGGIGAVPVSGSQSDSPWRTMKELPTKPEPGMHINVRETVTTCYRWKSYKPNSQERKNGKLGRWQKFNGYGFDGSYSVPDGTEWQENLSISKPESDHA